MNKIQNYSNTINKIIKTTAFNRTTITLLIHNL